MLHAVPAVQTAGSHFRACMELKSAKASRMRWQVLIKMQDRV